MALDAFRLAGLRLSSRDPRPPKLPEHRSAPAFRKWGNRRQALQTSSILNFAGTASIEMPAIVAIAGG